MKTLRIKPAPGRLVCDPDTRELLSADGEEKPYTPFWCRRLNDGDVLVVEDSPEAPLSRATKEKKQ